MNAKWKDLETETLAEPAYGEILMELDKVSGEMKALGYDSPEKLKLQCHHKRKVKERNDYVSKSAK